MKDYFHLAFNDRILFKEWVPAYKGEFAGACIAIFLLSVIHEYIRYLRVKLSHDYRLKCSNKTSNCPTSLSTSNNPGNKTNDIPSPSRENQNLSDVHEQKPMLNSSHKSGEPLMHSNIYQHFHSTHSVNNFPELPCWAYKLFLTILYMMQTFLGFLLMLIFMTFNAYLAIMIVSGLTLGYFLFFLFLHQDHHYGTNIGATPAPNLYSNPHVDYGSHKNYPQTKEKSSHAANKSYTLLQPGANGEDVIDEHHYMIANQSCCP